MNRKSQQLMTRFTVWLILGGLFLFTSSSLYAGYLEIRNPLGEELPLFVEEVESLKKTFTASYRFSNINPGEDIVVIMADAKEFSVRYDEKEMLISPSGCSEGATCACVFRGFIDLEDGKSVSREGSCVEIDVPFYRAEAPLYIYDKALEEYNKEELGNRLVSAGIEGIPDHAVVYYHDFSGRDYLLLHVKRSPHGFVTCIDADWCEMQLAQADYEAWAKEHPQESSNII